MGIENEEKCRALLKALKEVREMTDDTEKACAVYSIFAQLKAVAGPFGYGLKCTGSDYVLEKPVILDDGRRATSIITIEGTRTVPYREIRIGGGHR